jgi:DNA repair exonuclease SbcCD ATPase subunit
MNITERIADNVWLKALERIAIPLIILLLWQQYQTLQSLQQKSPITDFRIESLEATVKASNASGEEATKQRATNQLALVQQITGLEKDVEALQKTVGEINAAVKDLTRLRP